MEARAQARYVRVTPMKARRVIDLIRGMQAGDAQDVLRFAPQAASEPVGKVLASAIANATNNHGMQARDLVIAQAFVDEGPTLKRIRPRAQGRAYRVGKRTSHITVVVSCVVTASLRKSIIRVYCYAWVLHVLVLVPMLRLCTRSCNAVGGQQSANGKCVAL